MKKIIYPYGRKSDRIRKGKNKISYEVEITILFDKYGITEAGNIYICIDDKNDWREHKVYKNDDGLLETKLIVDEEEKIFTIENLTILVMKQNS